MRQAESEKYPNNFSQMPAPYPIPKKECGLIGKGNKQELVVNEFIISPPSPPIFRIVQVDKEVVITNTKLIVLKDDKDGYENEDCMKVRAKVIIDGFIDKNVLYKTIVETTPTAVNGFVAHFTTRVDFATFVEVKSKERIKATDTVVIEEAFVEGENDELLNPNPVPVGAPVWAVTFNRLLEKDIVKISLKVIR